MNRIKMKKKKKIAKPELYTKKDRDITSKLRGDRQKG